MSLDVATFCWRSLLRRWMSQRRTTIDVDADGKTEAAKLVGKAWTLVYEGVVCQQLAKMENNDDVAGCRARLQSYRKQIQAEKFVVAWAVEASTANVEID